MGASSRHFIFLSRLLELLIKLVPGCEQILVHTAHIASGMCTADGHTKGTARSNIRFFLEAASMILMFAMGMLYKLESGDVNRLHL
jgi:hypothetical protein